VDLLTAWFDIKTHHELINLKFTSKIFESIGLYGLVGLDKLFSFMLANDLEQLHNQLIKKSFKEKQFIDFFQQFKQEMKDRQMNPRRSENPQRFYSSYTTKGHKIWPNIIGMISIAGHKIIWRQHIAYELNTTAKFNSKNLEGSLRAFNESLLMELKNHELDESKSQPSQQLIAELNKYLENVGLYDPLEKIYIKSQKSSNELVIFSFLLVISHLNRLAFGKNLLKLNAPTNAPATNLPANVIKQRKQLMDTITPNKFLDAHVFLQGLVSFLKQFNENNYVMEFVEIYCQFLLENVEFYLR
jgi:WASH complex subunit strumpellin